MFALGIITGILIVMFLLVLDIWLSNRGIGVSRGRDIIKRQTMPKSQILKPQSQREKDIDKIISENEKRGKDTLLEELL